MSYLLTHFVSFMPTGPAFVIPVFSKHPGNKAFAQEVDSHGKIACFREIDIGRFHVQPYNGDLALRDTGERAVFAVRFAMGKIRLGSFESLSDLLRNLDLNAIGGPFFNVEVLAFVGDKDRHAAAVHTASTLLGEKFGPSWASQELATFRPGLSRDFARAFAKDKSPSSLRFVDWISSTVANATLVCTECGSEALDQMDPQNTVQSKVELVCPDCGARPELADLIETTVQNALAHEAYTRKKDTNEDGPIYDCPACGRSCFIDYEEQCPNCGEELDYAADCMRCGADISVQDYLDGYDSGLCPNCSYQAEKNYED